MSETIPDSPIPAGTSQGNIFPESVEPFSVTDKFVGIFTEPSAVFDNTRATGPRVTDWIVPLVLFVIVMSVGTLLKFSNPEFQIFMREQQQKAIQEQVTAKKMTQEQATMAMESIEKFAPFQKVASVLGVVIFVPVFILLATLVFWLVVRFLFKGTASFLLVFAVFCLTLYIGTLDQLMTFLLQTVTGKWYVSITPAAFLPFDQTSRVYRFLSNLDPFIIWSLFVFGIGLYRAASISKAKAFGLVYGLWVLWLLAVSFIKIPGMS
ncbi:MAG: YIP1 family protein [Bacteroidota bacterium]|nr:YIP1 family protein [Bacteroidota bacterium]